MIPTDPPGVAEAQWAGLAGELAFDVGAHLGENFGHLRAAGAKRIVAFEPEQPLFDRLPEDDDVEAVHAAVCGRSGYLELRRANGMLGNLTGDERVVVPSVSLDAAALMFGVPDIVVVDVEGFEMQVLAGADLLLEEAAPSWLVEFHSEPLFHAVRDTLAGSGYVPEVIRHPHYAAGSGLWLGHGWIKAVRP